MREWWRSKKEVIKKSKNSHHYSFFDLILDVLDLLFWIPELIILPFRLIYSIVRGFGKLLGNMFDFV
ncbi:hypothetical protein CFK37_18590 [Virgibacillus phasianinus]|uniref:Uncharacterized protein n=1 Tax=Virgibacillus phasianinus TaxID=2017483 RepID=A0A220U7D7_9BACI|nr:hypothetical protein CFK37_18590 [Virgibacillus phasianinus]